MTLQCSSERAMAGRMQLLLVLFPLLLLAIHACTSNDEDTIRTTGTITYVSLEGGFYGIRGDDGKNYDPVNLADEFRKDGLRVRFEAKVVKDRASFHMWGTIVEVMTIQKL